MESHDLAREPKVVLKIALQSHYFSGNRMRRSLCGSTYNYYSLTTITMKEDGEGIDIYEAFNKETGVFMVPEDGLYMIIVGDSNFDCAYDYVVVG